MVHLNENLKRKLVPGYYRRLFSQLNIKHVSTVLEDYRLVEGYDEELFERIPTVSKFTPVSTGDIQSILLYTGVEIKSLDSLKEAIDSLFEIYKRNGIKAIKFGSAYVRSLFIKRSRASHLNNIINAFPEVKIVLLHCGFPYVDDSLLLAKYYPDVLYEKIVKNEISESQTVDILKSWFE